MSLFHHTHSISRIRPRASRPAILRELYKYDMGVSAHSRLVRTPFAGVSMNLLVQLNVSLVAESNDGEVAGNILSRLSKIVSVYAT